MVVFLYSPSQVARKIRGFLVLSFSWVQKILCNCRRRMKICPGWWSSEITDPCRFYWQLPRFTCQDASQQCENKRRKDILASRGWQFIKKKSLTGKKYQKHWLRCRMFEMDVHVNFWFNCCCQILSIHESERTPHDFGGKPTAQPAGEQVASWATFLGNSVGGLKHYIAQMLGGFRVHRVHPRSTLHTPKMAEKMYMYMYNSYIHSNLFTYL